ncbi:MAG: nucleotidyltransferase domain-containing protein [Planctomycetes bacterium]|nr:nucleotidyltransferase domain-containing protein [Planctomycetota bacterium]
MTVTPKQIAQHFLKRAERREQFENQLLRRAHGDLSKLVDLLAKHYDIRRIVLFGSMISGRLHSRSDIDLAVEGLSASKFFKAVGDCLSVSELPVGLVRLEDAPASLKKRIEEEGKVLYDRQGKIQQRPPTSLLRARR